MRIHERVRLNKRQNMAIAPPFSDPKQFEVDVGPHQSQLVMFTFTKEEENEERMRYFVSTDYTTQIETMYSNEELSQKVQTEGKIVSSARVVPQAQLKQLKTSEGISFIIESKNADTVSLSISVEIQDHNLRIVAPFVDSGRPIEARLEFGEIVFIRLKREDWFSKYSVPNVSVSLL
eukprot:TRINITY_DN16057_c0_g1_i2.p1 TRINITY_DN16057_c0_g1~~TRINITY_DN16057_c0_g1_i2.p1  ORF type:complete len:177 (-),score=30.72 TRINITY_DN16057_c0_g1_i2:51-581(-)